MNQPDCPFHYQVRFSLLAYQNNNNLKIQSRIETYKSKNPLEARKEAFKDFHEYLSFKKSNNLLLVIDENYRIVKPSPQKFGIDIEYFESYKSFNEEVAVYLIIDNKQLTKDIEDFQDFQENSKEISGAEIQKNHEFAIMLAEANEKLGLVDSIDNEFLIHKVGSSLSTTEEQKMIDNLEFTEMKLYKHCNIDTSDYETTVAHYGLDYYESGEDEDQCKSTILETPHIWSTKERYLKEFATDKESLTGSEHPSVVTYEEIIARGEGECVEFKPSIGYDFDLGRSTRNVRYKIARNICSFLNTKGGILFIGVDDDKMIQGLEVGDYLLSDNNNKQDVFRNEFDRLFYFFFSAPVKPYVSLKIERIDNKDIGVIFVEKSKQPVFLKNRKHEGVEKEFFVRAEASSRLVTDVEEIIQYVFNNWRNF